MALVMETKTDMVKEMEHPPTRRIDLMYRVKTTPPPVKVLGWFLLYMAAYRQYEYSFGIVGVDVWTYQRI